MKINNTPIYDKNLYLKVKNKYARIVEKLSSRDVYSDTLPIEYIELRKIYDNLWKQMELPDNLKPRIQFKAMLSIMGFSIEDYHIYVDKRLSPFKMRLRNITGKNESLLRHEIEHVKQFWNIVRFIGADNMTGEFNTNLKWLSIKHSPNLLKKMQEIEKTFGRVPLQSQEYVKASKYFEALANYPDTSESYGIGLKELKKYLKYKNNLLEKDARKEASKYKPSFSKRLKTGIKEFFKLLKY